MARRGFTLVEILVVLVVVGLLVGLAPIAFDRLVPGRHLLVAAHGVADTLRQARSLAIRGNRARFVEIDVGTRTARIGESSSGYVVPDDVRLSLVVATTEQLGARTGRIRFYPDGTSTGGEVALAADHRVLTVVVDWFNGGVSLVDQSAS